jgi:hypothetical protein
VTSRNSISKSAAKIVLVCVFLFASFFAYCVFAEENAASVIAALGLRESIVAARDMKDWETPRKIVVLADRAVKSILRRFGTYGAYTTGGATV